MQRRRKVPAQSRPAAVFALPRSYSILAAGVCADAITMLPTRVNASIPVAANFMRNPSVLRWALSDAAARRAIPLFRTRHVTLGNHVDFVDRLRVVPDTIGCSVFLAVWGLHARPLGVENSLAGAGKCDTGGIPWQRDDSQEFSFGAENLNAGIASGHVKTALGVDGHPVAVATAFERGKVVLVGGSAIGLDIKGHQGFSVGYVERLFVPAERHAVCADFLVCDEADFAGSIDEIGAIVVGEVDAAPGIADEFAHAPERFALIFARQRRMLVAAFD